MTCTGVKGEEAWEKKWAKHGSKSERKNVGVHEERGRQAETITPTDRDGAWKEKWTRINVLRSRSAEDFSWWEIIRDGSLFEGKRIKNQTNSREILRYGWIHGMQALQYKNQYLLASTNGSMYNENLNAWSDHKFTLEKACNGEKRDFSDIWSNKKKGWILTRILLVSFLRFEGPFYIKTKVGKWVTKVEAGITIASHFIHSILRRFIHDQQEPNKNI
jgi:hypothetical protein